MTGDNSIKDLKNYLMKYISKGYIGDEIWSPGRLIFNAHLYGATHGNRPPKKRGDAGYQRQLHKEISPDRNE